MYKKIHESIKFEQNSASGHVATAAGVDAGKAFPR